MVLKASGMSTMLPRRSTAARLVRINLVVFLMKLFFTLNTVITIVLPIIPTMAKAVMNTPKNTLIPKDISFSIRPLFSSFIKEVLELEFSNAIALLHQITGTLKPRKGKKRIVLR